MLADPPGEAEVVLLRRDGLLARLRVYEEGLPAVELVAVRVDDDAVADNLLVTVVVGDDLAHDDGGVGTVDLLRDHYRAEGPTDLWEGSERSVWPLRVVRTARDLRSHPTRPHPRRPRPRHRERRGSR